MFPPSQNVRTISPYLHHKNDIKYDPFCSPNSSQISSFSGIIYTFSAKIGANNVKYIRIKMLALKYTNVWLGTRFI